MQGHPVAAARKNDSMASLPRLLGRNLSVRIHWLVCCYHGSIRYGLSRGCSVLRWCQNRFGGYRGLLSRIISVHATSQKLMNFNRKPTIRCNMCPSGGVASLDTIHTLRGDIPNAVDIRTVLVLSSAVTRRDKNRALNDHRYLSPVGARHYVRRSRSNVSGTWRAIAV